MNQHKARRYGNEWQCSKCGKAWHVNDEDVPDCVDVTTIEHKTKRLNEIREQISEA